jgi:hypothetical protein
VPSAIKTFENAEHRHPEPTPEMEFIFNLMTKELPAEACDEKRCDDRQYEQGRRGDRAMRRPPVATQFVRRRLRFNVGD